MTYANKQAFDELCKYAIEKQSGLSDDLQLRDLQKNANTRLRSLFRLVNQERLPLGRNKSFAVQLGSRPIGSVTVGRPVSGDLEIANVILDKKFQGMGLGKKLYGELMRLANSGHINSPPRRSNQAAGLWQSIRKRPNDYTVTEVMTPFHRELPSFRAGLTRPTPRHTPIAFDAE